MQWERKSSTCKVTVYLYLDHGHGYTGVCICEIHRIYTQINFFSKSNKFKKRAQKRIQLGEEKYNQLIQDGAEHNKNISGTSHNKNIHGPVVKTLPHNTGD